jgi:anti-sigma B factor antagonist
MEIQRHETGDVAVLRLRGRLVRGVGDDALRQTLDALLSDGWRKIVVNLAEVPFIDSSGVGELVAGKKVAEGVGARLTLVEVGNRVEGVLKLSLILPLFDIHPDESTALASLS